MSRLASAVMLVVGAAGLAAAASACSGNGSDPDDDQQSSGSGGGASGGGGGDAGGLGNGGGGSEAGTGGEPTPVIVSVSANAQLEEGATATTADIVEAELVAYAAGARGAALAWEWRASDPEGPGGATEIAAFSTTAIRALQLGRVPMFELVVVDARRDLRPTSLAGLAWDDPAVLAGLEATLDTAFTAYGGELATIALGRDVNVYLAEHPADRMALVELLTAAATYAAGHPEAPADLVVGVGLRSADAVADPTAHKELLVAGTGVFFGYVPGDDGSVGVDDVAFVPADLDAMVALAGSRPIALTTGYPSSPSTGSDEARQASFYRAVFEALEPRRAAFHFVNAFRLHDVPPGICAAELEALGRDTDGGFADAWCSLGVRAADGTDKPVWTELLSGLAAFATP